MDVSLHLVLGLLTLTTGPRAGYGHQTHLSGLSSPRGLFPQCSGAGGFLLVGMAGLCGSAQSRAVPDRPPGTTNPPERLCSSSTAHLPLEQSVPQLDASRGKS